MFLEVAVVGGVGVAGAVGRVLHRTVVQMRSMQLIEVEEQSLADQEGAYSEALELACRNFQNGSPAISAHLIRIHSILCDRRDCLKRSKQLVASGSFSLEQLQSSFGSGWREEVTVRLSDLKAALANYEPRGSVAMQ